jgi:hypothetical protein
MATETQTDVERRLDALERKMSRTDRRSGLEAAFWALMHDVFPEEARKHMKAAGREQLLAARAYLDHWIARLGEREDDQSARHESIEIS